MSAFWTSKGLAEMTPAEWESLCDGCGRCCLRKLQDERTGRVAYTDVACRLLDRERCRCTHYAERHRRVRQRRLHDHLQRLSLRFYTSTRTGEILSRISTDVNGVQDALSGSINKTPVPAGAR